MTLEAEHPSTVPTGTSVGLEAWLSGAHALATDAAPVINDACAGGVEAAPVNAAEALVLRTFSSPRSLKGPDGAELLVDPAHDAYYFESKSLKPLSALLAQPASHWTPAGSDALALAAENHRAQPLERLRWYAGLVATPGILSRRLPRGVRCQLAGWPETEREFPRHFRIAHAMLQAATTIDEIAAASGMPVADVTDYVNASHAAGRLVEPTASATRTHAGSNRPSSRTARLVARLNKPLFVR